MKFEEYLLEDVLDIKYGKNQKKVKDDNGPYPILGTGGLMGYATEYLYDKPSVLIGRKGSISKVRYIDEPFWTVDTLFYTIVNEEIVYPKFIYYYLSQIDFNYYNEGTTIPSLRIQTLNQIILHLPDLKYQAKILKMINPIEERIELNSSIISNLEELAQTLFKRWFVDFEFANEEEKPYKSSGGKMVESELGMIPEGWEVKTLKDLIEIIDNRGKTPPLVDYSEYPIIDVKALSGDSRVINYDMCTKYVNKNTYDNWFRRGHPQRYDILFSTVGSIASMKMFFEGNFGTIAQNVVALRSIAINPFYLYQYLIYQQEEIKQLNIGSVQPSIKVTHFIKKKILVPNKELYDKFKNTISSLSVYINSINKENVKLMNVRDTLLPKLLSGEIELPDDLEVMDDVPVS